MQNYKEKMGVYISTKKIIEIVINVLVQGGFTTSGFNFRTDTKNKE
jgi:hypothetical protein